MEEEDKTYDVNDVIDNNDEDVKQIFKQVTKDIEIKQYHLLIKALRESIENQQYLAKEIEELSEDKWMYCTNCATWFDKKKNLKKCKEEECTTRVCKNCMEEVYTYENKNYKKCGPCRIDDQVESTVIKKKKKINLF